MDSGVKRDYFLIIYPLLKSTSPVIEFNIYMLNYLFSISCEINVNVALQTYVNFKFLKTLLRYVDFVSKMWSHSIFFHFTPTIVKKKTQLLASWLGLPHLADVAGDHIALMNMLPCVGLRFVYSAHNSVGHNYFVIHHAKFL